MLNQKLFKPLTQTLGKVAAISAANELRRFEKKLCRCAGEQDKLLQRILRAGAESDFGHQHSFSRIGGYKDFAAALPIANYQYFSPYIEKCQLGNTTALLGPGQKLLMFALTSGTTGPAKCIPVTAASARSYRKGWNIWGVKALADHPEGFCRKILQISGNGQEYLTQGGHPCGAISGMMAKNQKFIVRHFYVLSAAVANIDNAEQKYYTIMRLAMAQDVGFISTANPSTLVMLAHAAETNAEKLLRDIHDGTLSGADSLPSELYTALKKQLRPNAIRAKQLRHILDSKGKLRPRDYWNLAFIAHWTGGTLGLYLPQVKEYYGNVAVRDIGLLASEGRMSIPLQDHTPAGVLDITANFYEFVPEDQADLLKQSENAATIDGKLNCLRAEQLIKGEKYYILLTNQAGLYRYNIGDLISVTGYHHNTPIIEFLSKGTHISSITGEKLTENQVVTAVRQAAGQLSILVDNFIMAPKWGQPPCYSLSLVSKNQASRAELINLADKIDRQLSDANIEYQAKRKSGRLGNIQIQQLPDNILEQRDNQLRQVNKGRSEQFKHRFLYNEPIDITQTTETETKTII